MRSTDEEGLGALDVLLGLGNVPLGKVEQGEVAMGIALLGGVLLGLVRANAGVKPLCGASPVPPCRAAPAARCLVFAITGRDTAQIVETACPAALILCPLRILQR